MSSNSWEDSLAGACPIAALAHPDGTTVDRALQKIASRLKRRGHRLAGALRAHMASPGEGRCDLFLEDLSTSTVYPMSQDLGPGSQACRLDDVALDVIAQRVEDSLQNGADILILNKFGKLESEGRGLRSPIVEAVDRGIPVLVGLSSGRVDSWNNFCGTTSDIFSPDDPAVNRWLEMWLPVQADPRL